jgi:hypothetical protein
MREKTHLYLLLKLEGREREREGGGYFKNKQKIIQFCY